MSMVSATRYLTNFQKGMNSRPLRSFAQCLPLPDMTRLPTIRLQRRTSQSAKGETKDNKISLSTMRVVSKGEIIAESQSTSIIMIACVLAWVIGGLILSIGKAWVSMPLVALGAIMIGVGFGILLGYSLSEQGIQDSKGAF